MASCDRMLDEINATQFMAPKRTFWKELQKMKCVFSRYF